MNLVWKSTPSFGLGVTKGIGLVGSSRCIRDLLYRHSTSIVARVVGTEMAISTPDTVLQSMHRGIDMDGTVTLEMPPNLNGELANENLQPPDRATTITYSDLESLIHKLALQLSIHLIWKRFV
jgi:hypothetical protein